jgi:hypothetical protein
MNNHEPELLQMLREQWEDLTIIGDDHSIALYKLTDERIENLHVDDNGCINFSIERHGRTTMGSPYADVHQWVVDLAAKTAWIAGITPRLIGKRSQPIDVAAVLTTILDALKNEDETIVDRTKDGRRRIKIEAVIPDGVKETTQKRKKAIRKALNEALAPEGRSVNSRWIVEDEAR